MPKNKKQRTRMNEAILDCYRCPEGFVDLGLVGQPSEKPGFFRFGPNILYGQCSSGSTAEVATGRLHDALKAVTLEGSTLRLPFDPTAVIQNLRYERYMAKFNGKVTARFRKSLMHKAYYLIRPLLPVAVRRHIQEIHLRGWEQSPFPQWPIDQTVENLVEQILVLLLESKNIDRLPFIWFWPHGFLSCTSLTHDVETSAGRDFCEHLMDIDDSFGIKASFQLVPENRYKFPEGFLTRMRERGFEINIHDLNHDGRLFSDREEFLRRAHKINEYGKDYGALGFRSGGLYRNLDWYEPLEFVYDMSVSNLAHLEAQAGGACTVMPYFVGTLLELPLTTTQDYSLFHILGQYSLSLWKQ